MSMEAQFYEARRRQSWVERRNSVQNRDEIPKPRFPVEHHSLHIPVRVFRHSEADRHAPWTTLPMHRSKITHNDQSLFRRDRDIYPRATTARRTAIRGAVLLKRFSSTEYLQQW